MLETQYVGSSSWLYYLLAQPRNDFWLLTLKKSLLKNLSPTPGVSLFPLRVLCSYLFVGDGPEFRDNVISSDAIPHLLTLVSSGIPVECLFDEVH